MMGDGESHNLFAVKVLPNEKFIGIIVAQSVSILTHISVHFHALWQPNKACIVRTVSSAFGFGLRKGFNVLERIYTIDLIAPSCSFAPIGLD